MTCFLDVLHLGHYDVLDILEDQVPLKDELVLVDQLALHLQTLIPSHCHYLIVYVDQHGDE